jgi:hypothetical protein
MIFVSHSLISVMGFAYFLSVFDGFYWSWLLLVSDFLSDFAMGSLVMLIIEIYLLGFACF